MYVIKEDVRSEMIINKSRFITYFYKVYTEDECKEVISKLNKEYSDATHVCYAYIINNTKRFNDDNEPNGTAGMPILNVIESNNLNYCLCAVVRYFGGIKLGAGGLVRAYTSGPANLIKEATKCLLVDGYKIKINFNYKNSKIIDNLLKNITIINKVFNDEIEYTILISAKDYEEIPLNKYCDINVLENIQIENDDY